MRSSVGYDPLAAINASRGRKATPAQSCIRGMNFTTEVLCCTCQARTVVPLPRFERQTIWCGFNCVIGNLVARGYFQAFFFLKAESFVSRCIDRNEQEFNE